MRLLYLLGGAVVATDQTTDGLSQNAGAEAGATDNLTNAEDTGDRQGSLTLPSTWTGRDTRDDADVKFPYANQDDSPFNEDMTSDADGEGWTMSHHEEQSYDALVIKDLWCNAVDLMEFHLALTDEHTARNSAERTEVILSKFLCMSGGSATVSYTAGDSDSAGIEGVVSLNPYECNVLPGRDLTDSKLSDSSVEVDIEFRVVSNANQAIEFHKYRVQASCEFNDYYNTNTAFEARQKTTGIDTEIFQLLDTDFGMDMSAASMAGDAGDAIFRANEKIQALIFTSNKLASNRKWDKIHQNVGYAPTRCQVEQQSDTTQTIVIFDIYAGNTNPAGDDIGGHQAIELEMKADSNLRVWLFSYIAFVMASDDASGDYELQCRIQPCYYAADSAADNVCVKTLALEDVTGNDLDSSSRGADDDMTTLFANNSGEVHTD